MLRSMSAQKTAIAEQIASAASRRAAGDFPAAMQILGALFEKHPGDRDVLVALAQTGAAMGGRDEALALVEFGLQVHPADIELRLQQAALLEQLGRPVEAEAALANFAAACIDPLPLMRLGYLQRRLLAYERALASATALTEAHPFYAPGWVSLGISLYTAGDLAAAEACFDTALALAPDDPVAEFSRGTCLLAGGRWRDGFRGFSARHRFPDAVAPPADLPAARGGERRLLLWNDQGLGDAIQFLRYVPLLRRGGYETVLLLPASLTRLARAAPGVGPVLAPGDPLPPLDAHLPMMDVPVLLGLDEVPAEVPYIATDPQALALPGLKVGLVWAGELRDTHFQIGELDRRRRIAPEILPPLLAVEGASFVSLQFGAPALPGTLDAMAAVRDFAGTAAIVAGLDLVITVDTSVAHLAGALGKPVWVLSRHDGCWRWMRNRADSPWYPSARVFRQSVPGDWAGVIAEIAASLGERIAARI